ncbi:vascular non-inflammatory molecule 2 [Tachyglossus aculeatus]|uniref:vascular non-inflammatory molecule 2 n=1 Tax=Tachyglossus aculeatus TaxID=9261 RepID=UPI0018F3933D|nr:vascular non-inflammatory molecule 2 [Tachyglossus aculeatus]
MIRVHICVAAVVLWALEGQALDSFVAAVYEHVVTLPDPAPQPVSPQDALALMNKNMDVLEEAIKSAAEQGALIIVTPEDAIYGWIFTRETIYPYLEDIPDPQVNWIPCTEPHRFGHTPVQERLSCLAKNHSIYVVANMGDKKPCNASDPRCPGDGRYQYNTNVVFDADGKLVARYHKYNLFGESQFDVPPRPELVAFNTPFGKLGVFTCFDILFHDPAVSVVRDLHVDTVLFPTAWMNALPFLTAIEFHSAWAMGMGVNLLVANTHNTTQRMTGSGIYAPESPKVYHYNMKTETGKLLISKLDSHPSLSPTYPVAVNWSTYATSIKPFLPEKPAFPGNVSRDKFTFAELTGQAGNVSVCQKDICCHLSYRMAEKRNDEVYVLGAFDGLHGSRRKYYWEVCTLLKCNTTNLKTCGRPVETALTRFEMYSLSGTFGTQYVFPEVLLSEIQLAPGEFQVLRDGRLVNHNGISKPILTATLFGRRYEKDESHTSNGLINTALIYLPGLSLVTIIMNSIPVNIL